MAVERSICAPVGVVDKTAGGVVPVIVGAPVAPIEMGVDDIGVAGTRVRALGSRGMAGVGAWYGGELIGDVRGVLDWELPGVIK